MRAAEGAARAEAAEAQLAAERDELVQRYERPLFAYLSDRLGNHLEAEEAAQESFVRAFASLGKLHKPASFYAWLLGIAAMALGQIAYLSPWLAAPPFWASWPAMAAAATPTTSPHPMPTAPPRSPA